MSKILASGGSGIKSIQRGTATITSGNTSATATITAVVTANTRIKFLGCNDAGADTAEKQLARVALTNTTTVTATVGTAPTGNLVVAFEVVEYYSGVLKSVQRGTISITAGNTTGTASISAVVMANSELTYLGATPGNGTGDMPWLTLTNTTTVTATNKASAAGNVIVGYEVAEYY